MDQKQQTPTPKSSANSREYFFPEFNMVVTASSLEEAEKKVKAANKNLIEDK